MLVPFRNVDGTVIAPGITFTNEPSSGLWRAGNNDVRMAIGSDDTTRWIDANSEPVGEQSPFQIWNGTSFQNALTNNYFGDVLFEGDLNVSDGSLTNSDGNQFVQHDNSASLNFSWTQYGTINEGQNMSMGYARGQNNMQWRDGSNFTGNIRMQISTAGELATTTGVLGTISERKYKSGIREASSQVEDIKQLARLMKSFVRNDNPLRQIGWIVDEIEDEFPNLIGKMGDDKGIKIGAVPLKAVKALGEIIERVEALEQA